MTSHPFFADRMPVWAELDDLLGTPDFDQSLTGINATYRRLQAFGRVLGPARDVHRDPARLLAGMEWAGIVDPATMHAAMVHYGVATTALLECGHPGEDLDSLLGELDSMDAPGAIVATELGRGGSQMNIRTEARYDRVRDTFAVHTPDDAALKIMPNVGWSGLPRIAVVNARLMVDGTDHGVHAFAFRFPHPGAEVALLPGSAPVPLDYAVIRFRNAEIPRGNWLSDTATLTSTGLDDPLTAPQRLARSLGGVNAAVVSAATALTAAARAAVAITARYNTQRLIGHPGTPALEFSTHRTELASAIAHVYATGFYVDKARRDFIAGRTTTSATAPRGEVANASYAPWLAADRDRTLAKAAATTMLETVTATCRRLCGFQGVLHANRITVYEDMARSFHAAGGDTRLLLLEAGKQLVDDTDADPAADHPRSALHLVSLQEDALARRLRHCLDRNDPNSRLHDIEQLARTHIARRTLQEFLSAVNSAQGHWRPLLEATQRLHGINVLLDSATWHLNDGSLRPGDVDVLHQARTAAAELVTRNLGTLIDGLAVPAGRAGGFIGRAGYIDRIATQIQASP